MGSTPIKGTIFNTNLIQNNMLIIEIILTVFAWRKGWKWLALLPVGIALLIGFIIGFSVGFSGGDVSTLGNGVIFIDVMAIIALIIMIVKGPKTLEQKEKIKNE